jgi:hypothetical protein
MASLSIATAPGSWRDFFIIVLLGLISNEPDEFDVRGELRTFFRNIASLGLLPVPRIVCNGMPIE